MGAQERTRGQRRLLGEGDVVISFKGYNPISQVKKEGRAQGLWDSPDRGPASARSQGVRSGNQHGAGAPSSVAGDRGRTHYRARQAKPRRQDRTAQTSAHSMPSAGYQSRICTLTVLVGGRCYYYPRSGVLQSHTAGRDGPRFRSRQTASSRTRNLEPGDTTTGSWGTPPGWLGRGQVGSVAFGVMGTATCRSQEVRDKCWRQEFRPIPGAEVCLTLASVHGLCARTTAFAALEVLPKALQRGKNHLPLGMRRLRASPWPPHAAREAGGTEALGLSTLPP